MSGASRPNQSNQEKPGSSTAPSGTTHSSWWASHASRCRGVNRLPRRAYVSTSRIRRPSSVSRWCGRAGRTPLSSSGIRQVVDQVVVVLTVADVELDAPGDADEATRPRARRDEVGDRLV